MAVMAQESLAAIQSGNTITLTELDRLTRYFLGRTARKTSCASCVVGELKLCIAKSAQMLAEFFATANQVEVEQLVQDLGGEVLDMGEGTVALVPNGNAIVTKKRKSKKADEGNG